MAGAFSLDLEPDVQRRVQHIAALDADVLITGPSGSGKTEVARRVHELSASRDKPFVLQNCAAIPPELAESTLFGHERGAFTGAHQARAGIVAAAQDGTLFLDEIGELSLAVQAKLLTLLQDRTYRPVGSTAPRSATFRLIAATNRDLLEQCNQGHFREDLYHRINVLSITLPPLRDTPEKAYRIAAEEVKRSRLPPEHAAEVLSAVKRLAVHPSAWPGNIRELRTFVKRCTLVVEEEERRTLAEWARWRRPDETGRLAAIAPSVSPSLADRERYAGMIHRLAASGSRPKAAASRKGSLALASRLLDVFPDALSMDEVHAVLGVGDQRSLKDNIKLLVDAGLVHRSGEGIVASWPPATSSLLARRRGEWQPVGFGEIPSLGLGDRVRLEVTSKLAATLSVMLITHRAASPPAPAVILHGKELLPSKTTAVEIELDGNGGLEQILVHVGPRGHRGGHLVEPTLPDALMPDSTALERGRREVLAKWREGWLAEHLVFHEYSK